MSDLTNEISKLLLDPESMRLLEKKFNTKSKSFDLKNCLFSEPSEHRIRQETLKYSYKLVNEQFKNLSEVINEVKGRLFYLSSESYIDNFFLKHLLDCFISFTINPNLIRFILRRSEPFLNAWTEKIIRHSLWLDVKEKIQKKHIQILFLSAYFHPLRQNVGSCFGTALAILIQKEQPELFFKDLESLLNQGFLKRTFLAYEHSAPIATSWGPGPFNKVIKRRGKKELWEAEELKHSLEAHTKNQEWDYTIFLKKSSDVLQQLLTPKLLIETILRQKHGILEDKLNKEGSFVSFKAMEVLNLTAKRKEFSSIDSYEKDLSEAQLKLIDFQENPLLKTWEYTLASFAETHSQFYKWNLYVSLGFDPKKPFSIAACIHSYIEEKLKEYHEQIEFFDKEYEQAFFRVKMLERRVINPDDERTASWAKVEYHNHVNEMNTYLYKRDHLVDKNNRLAELLEFILKAYDKLFPLYFQEVYDPNMQEIKEDVFEDSPAGFRLVYKHGRQDPTLWTRIQSKNDFIFYLKAFFKETEYEIAALDEMKEFAEEYAQIVTKIFHLVETDNFIYGSFERICERYNINFPSHDLSKLDLIPYKPWCYISGGTTERLMQHYFKRENNFTKIEKKVASPTELFAFIVDFCRDLSPKRIEHYKKFRDESLIMLSPSHAFLFKPGWLPLADLWSKEKYSFTWIRDHFTQPYLNFFHSVEVTPFKVQFFLQTYFEPMPYFSLWVKKNITWPNYTISLLEFSQLVTSINRNIAPNLRQYAPPKEQIESWIYEFFPLTDTSEIISVLEGILSRLQFEKREFSAAMSLAYTLLEKSNLPRFLRPKDLSEIVKKIIAFTSKKTVFDLDFEMLIKNSMRETNLHCPSPIFFADTNWPYYAFSFLVNPTTYELDLWRVDASKSCGYPMDSWRKYFDESNPGLWSIFSEPKEYFSA